MLETNLQRLRQARASVIGQWITQRTKYSTAPPTILEDEAERCLQVLDQLDALAADIADTPTYTQADAVFKLFVALGQLGILYDVHRKDFAAQYGEPTLRLLLDVLAFLDGDAVATVIRTPGADTPKLSLHLNGQP